MPGTQSIGSLSSGDLEDPDFSKEQDLELKCARAFKAVLHFEQTHCLQVEVRSLLRLSGPSIVQWQVSVQAKACASHEGYPERLCSALGCVMYLAVHVWAQGPFSGGGLQGRGLPVGRDHHETLP